MKKKNTTENGTKIGIRVPPGLHRDAKRRATNRHTEQEMTLEEGYKEALEVWLAMPRWLQDEIPKTGVSLGDAVTQGLYLWLTKGEGNTTGSTTIKAEDAAKIIGENSVANELRLARIKGTARGNRYSSERLAALLQAAEASENPALIATVTSVLEALLEHPPVVVEVAQGVDTANAATGGNVGSVPSASEGNRADRERLERLRQATDRGTNVDQQHSKAEAQPRKTAPNKKRRA